MSSIFGLQDEVELLSVSSRLQLVADGLKKIINGQQPEKTEMEYFSWAGDLTGEMDWNSKQYQKHPELCVIATILRPKFYGALIKLGIPFDAGFFEGLYEP